MDGEDRFADRSSAYSSAVVDYPADLCVRFVAEEFRELPDAAERRSRIADLVSVDIIPRLLALHTAVPKADHPTPENIAELGRLVLSPDGQQAAAYVAGLREGGLTTDVLFSELLEPAAQLLGRLWDRDDVDFFDVTLGVCRLQALLSAFNSTQHMATTSDYRSVLMLTVPGEQHSFGVAMVERFLEAGGWQVVSEREAPEPRIADLVGQEWFAVAGVAMSHEANLDQVASTIRTIREHSCNRSIGVMVGGPAFSARPGLDSAVGADGTATSAPTAVVLAQKLLDTALNRKGHEVKKGQVPNFDPKSGCSKPSVELSGLARTLLTYRSRLGRPEQ
jgi:methanogenic corrinoid protein MtbC1